MIRADRYVRFTAYASFSVSKTPICSLSITDSSTSISLVIMYLIISNLLNKKAIEQRAYDHAYPIALNPRLGPAGKDLTC